MSRGRVIGVGSPWGGDQAGWQAVDRLRELYREAGRGAQIEWLKLDRPGVRLIEALRGAEAVVLIDALHGGGPTGRVHRLAPSELDRTRGWSSHGFGVAEALSLAEALGEPLPALTVLGIELGGADDAEVVITDAVRAQLWRWVEKALECSAAPAPWGR